ncbi:MAG: class I SAM-dependent methyltransferase [Saprospiraceae bacterium]
MTHQDILEWDIPTWARALGFWEKIIDEQSMQLAYGLEIGAHHGGISLFFAKRYGAKMVCTDLNNASEKAKSLHLKYNVGPQIEYITLDATQIPFPENSFDFVVFKSVLGAIGRNDQPEKQQQAIAEIHRVLKPGGILFFAENLQGSTLHRLARRFFVPWGKSWRYLTLNELSKWLSVFEYKNVYSTGFLSAFVPNEGWLKNQMAGLDNHLSFLPKNWKYVAFGFARKKIIVHSSYFILHS